MNEITPKKSKTPMVIGCVAVGCLIPVVLIIVGIIGVTTWLQSYMSDKPGIAVYEPKPAEEATTKAKMNQIQRAIDSGRGGKVVLSDSDINTMIVQDEKGEKKHVRVHMNGSKLRAQAAIPVGEGSGKKYLNADLTVTLTIVDGMLYIHMKDAKVKGKDLPKWLQDGFKGKNLAEEFNKDPKNLKKIEHIEKLEVKDGKLQVTIKKGANKSR